MTDDGRCGREKPAPRASLAETLAGADATADAERRRGLRKNEGGGAGLSRRRCRVPCCAPSNRTAPPWEPSHRAPGPGWDTCARRPKRHGRHARRLVRGDGAVPSSVGHPDPALPAIKRKKDQLGEELGLRAEELPLCRRGGDQTARRPGGGAAGEMALRPVARRAGGGEGGDQYDRCGWSVELLRDEEGRQRVIDKMIVRRVAEPKWGPPIGRVLTSLLARAPGGADPVAVRPGVPVVAQCR